MKGLNRVERIQQRIHDYMRALRSGDGATTYAAKSRLDAFACSDIIYLLRECAKMSEAEADKLAVSIENSMQSILKKERDEFRAVLDQQLSQLQLLANLADDPIVESTIDASADMIGKVLGVNKGETK